MLQVLLVFVGGGIGSIVRHGFNVGIGRLWPNDFPAATLIINVLGSFTMGVVVAWFAFRSTGGLSQHARLFLTTGFLGGFTTFSTFSLDAATLIERDAYLTAAGYVVGSVGLGLLGLFVGLWLVRATS
ncbi:MAG TPA: fluoride efflux transporter CrcB [Bauldia sp.]|nr:fluoride efflux transporter CrcB [Bauldia sp.]